MMFRVLAAGALAGLVAVPALAQTAKVEPAKVQAGAYDVEPYHTQVVFNVDHMGFTPFHGFFTKTSGTLKLDPAKPDTSSLDIKIDTASVWTPVDKLTGELKSDQWLDATKFTEAEFKSTKVIRTGANTATVMGDFTLHGVTKPVTLNVRYINAGTNPLDKKYTVGFEATGQLKRSDFGVKTYVPLIGDEVQFTISAAFEQQG
jgi:polyisoprenoid-binding protein YceI